jgi:heat shock protein HslJ
VLLVIVAACAPTVASPVTSDRAPAATPALIGTLWHLTTYSDARGDQVSVLAGTQPTATFDKSGFVTGSGGCNAYSTVFQSAAMTLSFIGPISATHQICEQPVMDQEEAYFRVLPRSTAYHFEGDHLVLVQFGGARLAEFSH